MSPLDVVRTAALAIWTHAMRSFLTSLGIVIGVAAVITMVSVGAGAEAQVAKRIRSLGTNLIVVLSGSATSGGARLGSGTELTLSADDADAIEREVASVLTVAPLIRGKTQAIAGNRNWSTYLEGVTLSYLSVREWPVAHGTAFSAADRASAAKIAMIGQTVVEQLFPGRDPLGQSVRIGTVPLQVVGVLGEKGQNLRGEDQDDVILVPISTAQKRLVRTSRAKGGVVTAILVKVRDATLMKAAERDIQALLRQRHGLRPNQEDDFSLQSLTEIVKARQETERTLKILLASVASVSLLVGGIGVMNIMLVAVAERTREIGLRMALGARAADIRIQFLVESLFLALVGGLFGVGLGAGASALIAHVAGWPVLLEPYAVAIAVASAGAIGIFFGFYPADKAARLDPIDALR
jgi:putative ABC transport system permease protein